MKPDTFRDFVLDQLSALDGLDCRAMFGGHGLYRWDAFFGILFRGVLYLKVDDASRPGFERLGMGPFRPGKKQTLKSFYEVPPDVLENRSTLTDWARRAVRAAEAGRTTT